MLSDLFINLKKEVMSGKSIDATLSSLASDELKSMVVEQDKNGFTLLHWAASSGNIPAVNALLNVTGDQLAAMLSVGDSSGDTALHIAFFKGQQLIAQAILSKVLENDNLLSVLSLPNQYEVNVIDNLLLIENKETLDYFIAKATTAGLLNKVVELIEQEGVTLQDKLASEEFANREVPQTEAAAVVEDKMNASEKAVTVQPLTGIDLAADIPTAVISEEETTDTTTSIDYAQYLPNITVADFTTKAKDLAQYLPNITVADFTAKATAKDLAKYLPDITVADLTPIAPRDVIAKELLATTMTGWELKQSTAFIARSTQYEKVIAELKAQQAQFVSPIVNGQNADSFTTPVRGVRSHSDGAGGASPSIGSGAPSTPVRVDKHLSGLGSPASPFTPSSKGSKVWTQNHEEALTRLQSISKKQLKLPQKAELAGLLAKKQAAELSNQQLTTQPAVEKVQVVKHSNFAENVFYVSAIAHQAPQFLIDLKWLLTNKVGYNVTSDSITTPIDEQVALWTGVNNITNYIPTATEVGSLVIMSAAAKSPYPLVFMAAQSQLVQNFVHSKLDAEYHEFADIALSGALIASIGMVSVPGAITLLTIHAGSSALTFAIDHEMITAAHPFVLARPVLEVASHFANIYFSPYAVLKVMAAFHSAHALEDDINNNFEQYKVALGVTAEELSALRDKIATLSVEKFAIAQEWTSENLAVLKASGLEKSAIAQEFAQEKFTQYVAYVEASKEVSENPATVAWSSATIGGINTKIGASPAKIFKSALILDELLQLFEDLKVLGVKLPIEQYKAQLEEQLEIQIPGSYIKPAISVGSGIIMSFATKNAFPAIDAITHTASGQRFIQEHLGAENQVYANAGYAVVITGFAWGLGWFTAPVAAVCATVQLTDLGLDYALSHDLIPHEYLPYAVSAKPALDMVSQVANIALNPLKIVKAIEFIHLVREGFEYSAPYHEAISKTCMEIYEKQALVHAPVIHEMLA